MKDWMLLGRPHTASLTIPIVLLGAVLSHSDLRTLVLLGIWAFMFHWTGFTQNAIDDVDYDRADPNKAHFPLVRGTIPPRRAAHVYMVSSIVTVMYLNVLSLLDMLSTLVLVFGVLAFFLGVAYNIWSKEHPLISVSIISLSFACLPLVGFFSGPVIDLRIAFLVATYSFFLMFYQIGVGGFLKDIERLEQWNLLWQFGAYVDEGRLHPGNIGWLVLLRAPMVVLAGALAVFAGIWSAIGWVPYMFACIIFSFLSMAPGLWVHNERVLRIAVAEILAFWTLLTALSGLLGPVSYMGFIVLPMLWYMAWNKYLWNTVIAPAV